MFRRLTFLTVIAVLVLSLLAACAPAANTSSHTAGGNMAGMKMAPLDTMPAEVQKSSVSVQQAYQYAVANPDVLKQVPCYCGCGAMGHTSNYSCYVKSDDGGKIAFDQHALGCSICVDITQDTARMIGEGKNIQEIQKAIDNTYSQYGPPNTVQQ